jgi:catechol 2,3-dioxygenase-like lactoylglutathione lyase family enzyme
MTFSGGIRGANHVGIATPDIHGSVSWYVEVLGMRLLRDPEEVTEHAAAFGIHKAVFGHDFTGGHVAFLSTPDGFGIEFFQIDGAAANGEEGVEHH